MTKLIKQGRPVHRCETLAPGRVSLGAIAECECGRRWKLRRVSWSFKEWKRTVPTFVHDIATQRRAINLWAAVGRWREDGA